MGLELVGVKGVFLCHDLIQSFLEPFGNLVSSSERNLLEGVQRQTGQFGDRVFPHLPTSDMLSL